MSLEIIQAKRAALIARRDYQVTSLNGAIAACDELLTEIVRDQEVRKAADAKARWIEHDAHNARIAAQQMADEVKARFCRPPAPAMLPVSKFEPCDNCSTSRECELSDECRQLPPIPGYAAPDGDAA